MQPIDEVYVGHMLDVVKKIMAKTENISREQFDADENLRLALTHLLQTIGEAARRVSRELQAEHPEIPWAAIIGMRHKSSTTTWGWMKRWSGGPHGTRSRASTQRSKA